MTKKSVCKRYGFCFLFLVWIVSFALFIFNTKKAYALETSPELLSFLSKEHFVGDTVVIPDKNIVVGNDSVTADKTVVLPSGMGFIGDEIVLTESGRHKIVYSSDVGGKYVEEVETFDVYNYLYSTSSDASSIQFGNARELTKYSDSSDKYGLLLDLKNGDVFNYNQIIDVSEKDGANEIINFSIYPDEIGFADVDKIIIRLTDIYDLNNVLTIECKCSKSTLWTYVSAYTTGQMPQGFESVTKARADSKKTGYYYEGNPYLRHVNNVYGQKARFSFLGILDSTLGTDETQVGSQNLSLTLDYSQKRVFVNNAFIIDLDDPVLQSVVWNGFTTGECKLSVSATGYTGTSVKILMNKIDGKQCLSNFAVKDVREPDIIIDDTELKAIRYAEIGKPFAVPTATAFDSYSGDVPVDASVYVAYGSNAQGEVAITNGSFTPTQKRVYYLVYSAKDAFHNEALKIYPFEAVQSSDSVRITLSGHDENSVVGDNILLARPTVENNNGNYYCKIYSVFDGVEKLLLKLDDSDIETADYSFRPLNAGAYTVKYVYGDYFNEKTESYGINVSDGGSPVFTEEASVPKYVIKDMEYSAPELYGYQFVNGKGERRKADLYVGASSDVNTATIITDGKFTVPFNGNAYFTYKLGETTKTYCVPIADINVNGVMNIENLFYNYDAVDKTTDGLTYTVGVSDTDEGKYELEFINPVQIYDFKLRFKMPTDCGFKKISVYLINADNELDLMKFSFSQNVGSTVFNVNDYVDNTMLADYNDNEFYLTYKSESGKVNNGFASLVVPKANGYNRLDCEKVYLKFVIEKEDMIRNDAPAKLFLSQVNNQKIAISKNKKTGAENTKDLTAPEITTSSVTGNFKIGDVINVARLYAYDVIDCDPEFTFSVTYGNTAEYLTSTDGVRLENVKCSDGAYAFEVAKYGDYKISYTAVDASGNVATYYYAVRVIDEIAPTVGLTKTEYTLKVNSTLVFEVPNISDDLSESRNCSYAIYVETPDGCIQSVKADGYTFDKVGDYGVWYYAYDEAKNVSFTKVGVKVV